MLKLYLETSVFGFYYDESESNRAKREATRSLLSEVKQGLFEAVVSRITIMELLRLGDMNLRRKLLKLVEEHNIEPLDITESKEPELGRIADELLRRKVIPFSKRDDALHIGFAGLSPEIDVLVTWNCKHLANVSVFRKVKSALFDLGYSVKFEVATPEEVVLYG